MLSFFKLLLIFDVSTSLLTHTYGGPGGELFTLYNQGRISGIEYWGTTATKPNYHGEGITIKKWSADEQSPPPPYQWGTTTTNRNCTPFTLESNEYINGYRVIYDDAYIRYLGFHISNNNTFVCAISSTIINGLTNVKDTQWIVMDNVYLNGFFLQLGGIIDAMKFQFKYINNNNTFITTEYGGDDGENYVNLFDIGKINAIYNWGYSTQENSIIIANITSDQYKSDQTFGQLNLLNQNCDPFILNMNEYINGYRVMYNPYIHYIGLHTSLNKTYSCNGMKSSVTDTGWIIMNNNVYLSGFWLRWGGVIDSITFQFTYVQLHTTLSPTIIPTLLPTITPTQIPTFAPVMFAVDYGVVITVLFEYEFSQNTTDAIIDILRTVTDTIVNETVTDNCTLTALNKGYNIKFKTIQNQNKTLINATIFVCNSKAQHDLLIAIGNDNDVLEQDLIKGINNKINGVVIADNIVTVQTDIIGSNMVETTQILMTTNDIIQIGINNNNNSQFVVIILIIVAVILFLIVLIIITLYWTKHKLKRTVRKETINDNEDMNEVHGNNDNNNSVFGKNAKHKITNHSVELMDGRHDKTVYDNESDEENEDMYVPSENGIQITANTPNQSTPNTTAYTNQ